MTILAGARGQRYEVGTNLKGAGTPAAWSLLLPRLDLRTVIIVGSVPDAERAALAELAEHVEMAARAADAADLAGRGSGNASVDLVRVGRGGTSLLDRTRGLREALAARLSDRASAFVDWRGAGPDLLGFGLSSAEDLVVRPAFGPARLVVPARLAAHASRLPGARRAMTPAARPGRWRVRLDRLANRALSSNALERWATRGARLSTRSAAAGPPAWVAEIAASAGVDVRACGWALLAPGDYATQKVLLVLFDPGSAVPRTIVKITPDPAHGGRLRAEVDALTRLTEVDGVVGHVPQVEFAGAHAGRQIVGERWIDGRPFEAAATAGAESAQYAAASAWLTGLASATMRPASAADVGAALQDLLDRFRAVAPLSPAELDMLEADVRAIGSHGGTVPVVFQHGDPGTWNLVLDPTDRVVFLDWEASEPDGIPLWDLFHLQRSFGALAAQRDGLRGLDAGLLHVAGASPLQERFATEIREAARVVGLAPDLIAPLFFTCWMHRALKEVTRRPQGTLERAPYLRFLRAMLGRRDDPAVRHLLAVGGDR